MAERVFNIPKTNLYGKNSGFRGAIFDIDGTLLDSVSVWHDIDVEFLGRRGIDVPDDYMESIGHLKFKEIAEYTIKRFDLNCTPDELIVEWRAMALEAYSGTVMPKPGAVEYLSQLKERGVKIAVATALEKELYEVALSHTGLDKYIDVYATIYELNCEKGTPEVYEYAAREMGLKVDECIVFEDIVAGVRGAKQAKSETEGKQGFTVVGVYNEISDNIAMKLYEMCDYFIRDFKDLL